MDRAHRLLTEAQWFLAAAGDRDYPQHLLGDLRRKLKKSIDEELERYEADRQFATTEKEEALVAIGPLPDGWDAQVHSPSADLRYSATGPKVDGHRVVIFANDPKRLAQWASLYEVAAFVQSSVIG